MLSLINKKEGEIFFQEEVICLKVGIFFFYCKIKKTKMGISTLF